MRGGCQIRMGSGNTMSNLSSCAVTSMCLGFCSRQPQNYATPMWLTCFHGHTGDRHTAHVWPRLRTFCVCMIHLMPFGFSIVCLFVVRQCHYRMVFSASFDRTRAGTVPHERAELAFMFHESFISCFVLLSVFLTSEDLRRPQHG